MPGRQLTDHQVRLYMKFRQTDTPRQPPRQGIAEHSDGLPYRERPSVTLAEGDPPHAAAA